MKSSRSMSICVDGESAWTVKLNAARAARCGGSTSSNEAVDFLRWDTAPAGVTAADSETDAQARTRADARTLEVMVDPLRGSGTGAARKRKDSTSKLGSPIDRKDLQRGVRLEVNKMVQLTPD